MLYKKSIVFLFAAIFATTGELKAQHTYAKPDKETWIDKGVYDKDTRKKEISIETACAPDGIVFLENIYRQVIVRTSPDNKVRMETTVYYKGAPAWTDEEWFQKLDLEIRGTASQVVVKNRFRMQENKKEEALKKRNVDPNSPDMKRERSAGTGVAIFDSLGNWTNPKSNIKRNVVVYIPSGATLDIETKYNDIMIENNLKNVKINIAHASISLPDAAQITISSQYGHIQGRDFKNASIDMVYSKVVAGNIEKLVIDSKSSGMELASCSDITVTSNDDQYEIDEVTALKGEKNFGDIRITTLKRSFELKGANADIKIRYIDPGATHINIEDKYADIRLPLRNLANYAVRFEGSFNNVYTAFEKQIKKAAVKQTNKTDMPDAPLPPSTQNDFTAVVGDTKGSHLQLYVRCSNCTVDFK